MGIIDDIIRREGSTYTNDPADRGGSTKYGVTQRAWDDYIAHDPSHAPARDVAALTEEMARKFYEDVYVTPFEWIRKDGLRNLVIDSAIQHGTPRAVRWLQSAAGVGADGVAGPETRARVNQDLLDGLYPKVLKTRIKFYGDIVSRDPGQARFINGWLVRACEFVR